MGKLKSPKDEVMWRYFKVLQDFGNSGLQRTCVQKRKGTFNAKASNVEISSSLCVT
jgi:hypothetical protein